MTVYSPTGKNTGAAVVVFPGGGYWVLFMDLEGTEVCDWLTSKGITCVLLKYRVPGEHLSPRSGAYPKSPMALEDAQRTMGLVRFHAAEWHIDPHKIGVLGFSAGGHLVAAIWWRPSARILRSVCTRPLMPPTKKAAVRILPLLFIRGTCWRIPLRNLS
jgi:acetyl esterase/lipase